MEYYTGQRVKLTIEGFEPSGEVMTQELDKDPNKKQIWITILFDGGVVGTYAEQNIQPDEQGEQHA